MFRLSYSKNKHCNKDSELATTAQLYPGRDTFEFGQGHVTKNQPVTVLILVSYITIFQYFVKHGLTSPKNICNSISP